MFGKILLFLSVIVINQACASITYNCKFHHVNNPDKIEKLKKPFEFKIISDDMKRTYYLIGDIGSTNLTKVVHLSGVNFIEISDIGNITLTTIANNGKAVHSRNSLMFGDFIPSQYYGVCTIIP